MVEKRDFFLTKSEENYALALEKEFVNYQIYRLNQQKFLNFVEKQKDSFAFGLIAEEGPSFRLFLNPNPLMRKGRSEIREIGKAKLPGTSLGNITFKGKELASDGQVRFGISRYSILGFIELAGTTWYVESLSRLIPNVSKDLIILYKARDVKSDMGTCGFIKSKKSLDGVTLPQIDKGMKMNTCLEIVSLADFQLFQDLGSVNAAGSEMAMVLNLSEANFSQFNLQFDVVFLGVFSNGDPWVFTSQSSALLDAFRVWAFGYNFGLTYDYGLLFTDINLDGGTVSGRAYDPGACTANKYGLGSFRNLNTAEKRVLTAHEIGHGLDAPHDSSPTSFIMNTSIVSSATQFSSFTANIISSYLSANNACVSCNIQGVGNDDCLDAFSLNTCPSVTTGDVSGANPSGVPIPICSGLRSSQANDVWYVFTAQNTQADVEITPSSGFDPVIAAYTGTCNNLNLIDCEDQGGGSGQSEILSLSGLIPGTAVFVRVYEYNNPGTSTSFDICVDYGSPPGLDLRADNVQLSSGSVNYNDRLTASVDVYSSQNISSAVEILYGYSPTASFDVNTFILLGDDRTSTNGISAGQTDSESERLDIGLPVPCQNGYILVIVDPNNQYNDVNRSNNIFAVPLSINACPPGGVDLQIQNPIISATQLSQGQQISASLDVFVPIGSDPVSGAVEIWYGYSPTNSYNAATFIQLGNDQTSRNGINPGSTDGEAENLTIDTSVPCGSGYLLLVVDPANQVSETDESNNVAAFAISVSGSPDVSISANGSTNLCEDQEVELLAQPATGFQFQWLRNGQMISGAIQSTLFVDESGSYQVEIHSGTCSGNSNSIQVESFDDPEVSIQEQNGTLISQSNPTSVNYQWYRNNQLVSGANTSQYTPIQSGTYYVEVETAHGCSGISNEINFFITSMDEKLAAKLRVYPNPSINGIFRISLESGYVWQSSLDIEILDLRNKLIRQTKALNQNEVLLDLSKYPAGMYFLRIKSLEGVLIKKLVKAK
ncbi:MAG: M12 family metallo-peptidase [Bacteroidota bacterium]